MTYLYKHANPLWEVLIRRRLVHAVWSPLIQATRLRHLLYRRKLERSSGPPAGFAAPLDARPAFRLLP
jgi:hypothetical protein